MVSSGDKLLEALSQRQLLDTIPSGLFLVDGSRTILFWNRAAERITGFAADEVVGRHCSILDGIECGRSCGLFDPASPPKPLTGDHCRIRHKDGHMIILHKNIDLLQADGVIIGGIESFNDITEQKRLENELLQQKLGLEEQVIQRTKELESERRHLLRILDAMNDLAYIVGPNYRINFVNAAMRKVFGNICGELCYQAIHGIDAPCAECPWQEIHTGATVHLEQGAFPGTRTYDVIHTPLQTPDGIYKLAVCRDITERKLAHERLLEANRQLDAFVYTVSHDLRSPLTPIIGFAEFLQTEYRDQLDAQGLELLHDIESQGQRLLALLDDLLALSRVGHLPPPEQPVDTDAVLDRILLERGQERAGIEVSRTPLPQLPLPESLAFELLDNLMANALRYGCPDGAGAIEISGETRSSEVVLRVSDHGPGIPEKERQRVFDVFFRGSAAKGTSGTGIGLATVQKIVRLYDGQVQILDTAGGGCTFELRFPLNSTAT